MDKEAFQARYKAIWEDKWVREVSFDGNWIHHHLVDREGDETRVTTMMVGDDKELEFIEGEMSPSLMHRQ